MEWNELGFEIAVVFTAIVQSCKDTNVLRVQLSQVIKLKYKSGIPSKVTKFLIKIPHPDSPKGRKSRCSVDEKEAN